MLIFAGLGNPGRGYEGNRHNIGFMAVDALAERRKFSAWRQKFSGLLAEGEIAGEKILAFKPQKFMNLSGIPVAELAGFYKVGPEDIFVFHDELDLPLCKVRVKQGGGDGGHNGLKSITSHLGSMYNRVRLGIGHPGERDLVTPYVLGDFTGAERKEVEALVEKIADSITLLAERKESAFMSKIAL